MCYFIGIKGSGMAALAVMLKEIGNDVMGSDLKKHFFTDDELLKHDIKILPFNPNNIKNGYTVIIGNAFLEDFPEVLAARNNPTCKCYRYHEFVGELMKKYTTVSLCGSHGKTTTTTICKTVLSHFFKTAYLIGDGEGFLAKDSEYLCVESDEFRNHFHAYSPTYAIITNIEIDHVDFFKDEQDYFDSYQTFIEKVKKITFFYGDDSWCQKLNFKGREHYSFGFDHHNDFYIDNIIETDKKSSFDLYYHHNQIASFDLPLVGRHLLIDALGVIALSYKLGLNLKEVDASFKDYKGPKRRYIIEKYHNAILVDDYAHHPTEVAVTIKATRIRYPDKKIVAIFKPHRASRVLHFAHEFKNALELADKIYLLDFNSIDDKQDGTDIDINYLAKLIPEACILSEDEKGAQLLALNKDAVYLFMSSKDIYNLAFLLKKYL